MSSKAPKLASLSISKLDKADVLRVLFNNATPPSSEYNKRLDQQPYDAPLSKEDAQRLINDKTPNLDFDYIYGRAIRADISGSTVDLSEYAHQNPGALENAKQQFAQLHGEVSNRIASALNWAAQQQSPNEWGCSGDTANYIRKILDGEKTDPKLQGSRSL